jgi:hypothetical protein
MCGRFPGRIGVFVHPPPGYTTVKRMYRSPNAMARVDPVPHRVCPEARLPDVDAGIEQSSIIVECDFVKVAAAAAAAAAATGSVLCIDCSDGLSCHHGRGSRDWHDREDSARPNTTRSNNWHVVVQLACGSAYVFSDRGHASLSIQTRFNGPTIEVVIWMLGIRSPSGCPRRAPQDPISVSQRELQALKCGFVSSSLRGGLDHTYCSYAPLHSTRDTTRTSVTSSKKNSHERTYDRHDRDDCG